MTDSNPRAPVRVLVVDDQALMRDGLVSLLSLEPGIDVIGTAANGEEAYVVAALQAGAAGYLFKDLTAADLAHAIHAAHRRIYQLDSTVGAKLVAALAPPPPLPPRLGSGQFPSSPNENVRSCVW